MAGGKDEFVKSPSRKVKVELDFGSPEEQLEKREDVAERMMANILKSSRPKPSLSMTPSTPFSRGCTPVIGFLALTNTPNPPFESPSWYTAKKLFVTSWGCSYVGPLSDRFWLEAVDRSASGLPPKKQVKHAAVLEGSSVARDSAPAVSGGDLQHVCETPIAVGMQGSVVVFGFVMCSWSVEFGRESAALGDKSTSQVASGPLFALHPVGPQFRWHTICKMRRSFAHPRKCLDYLALCLDEKMKLGGAPLKHAKSIDAWGLFGLRDDSVTAFLREQLAPIHTETLDQTVSVLKERRKKCHVNAFLFEMLDKPFSQDDKLGDAPGNRDKRHTDSSESCHIGPRELVVRSSTEWGQASLNTGGHAPSYIPKSKQRRACTFIRSKDTGSWEKLAGLVCLAKPRRITCDLDISSPFMSQQQGENEEKHRRREGWQGPGSAHKLRSEQRLHRQWLGEREREVEEEKRTADSVRRSWGRTGRLLTFDRACKLSLYIGDVGF